MTRAIPLARETARGIALAALASLALGLLWTAQSLTLVERWEEARPVDAWAERGAFTYEPLLADGSGALPMGEPGYFTSEAPTLRVRFAWQLEDPQAERVTAVGTLALRLEEPGGKGRAPWTHTLPLAEGTLAGGADEPLVLEGELDLPAVAEDVARTPGRDAADAAWAVLATVRFASAPVETHRAEASEFALPIDHAPPLYVLPSEEAATHLKDHTRAEVVQHESRPGARQLVEDPRGPLALVAGIAALALVLPAATREEEASA